MQRLRSLGIPQAVLPPQPRPDVDLLRRLGFSGNDDAVLFQAHKHAPYLLAAASSGSSMWTANAATVCPSSDSGDGRVHFTPANLVTSLHRANEAVTTQAVLSRIFAAPQCFVVHDPLPTSTDLGDEGAANHTRFCDTFGSPGVHLFVYGRDTNGILESGRKRFPARQTRAASEAVARLHGLQGSRVLFAKQSPVAIDAGVFHNDVIAVGHRNVLLCHQRAFENQSAVLDSLRHVSDPPIQIVEVTAERVSLDAAVSTYLFNSQIVSSIDDVAVLVAPEQCRQHVAVRSLIETWVEQQIFGGVEYVDVGQSMNNGGGPACLRLRVVLTPQERSAIEANVFLDDSLAADLTAWIERHYRDHLDQDDLADPKLLSDSHAALDELTRLLGLGSVFPFQR